MKTMMKRILAFALAALLILGMTVTGAAADPALNQKLKINQVAAGDTVKAYRLIEYDATFNGYTFYASFETFLEAEKNAAGFNSLSVQEYFTERSARPALPSCSASMRRRVPRPLRPTPCLP